MSLENVNWIDALLLSTIVLSMGYGLFRGLIRSIFGIVSLVLAFFVAKKYGDVLAQSMSTLFGETPLAVVISYVLVFVIVMLLFSAFTYLVRKAATKNSLGGLDMYGGMLFGALRGGLLAMVFVVMLSALPMEKAAVWKTSVMLPPIGKTIQFSLKQDVLKKYRAYWRFDKNGRPRIRLPAGALQVPDTWDEDVAQSVQARDDLLDKLNDEATSQSLHNNEEAKRNALATRDSIRKKSALQEIKSFLDEALELEEKEK